MREFWIVEGSPLIIEWKLFHIDLNTVANFGAAEIEFFYNNEMVDSYHTYVDIDEIFPLQRQDGFYVRFNTKDQSNLKYGKNAYVFSAIDAKKETTISEEKGIVNLYVRDESDGLS
jgi:hypothetical protein